MALSDNFETIKEFAAGAAQTAAKKTRQLATIAKDNLAIFAEEEKIKKAQQELGKLYYKDFVMEEEPDEAEYLPWCEKITQSRKTIEALRIEIEQMRAETQCDEEDVYEAEFEEVAQSPETQSDAEPEEAAAEAQSQQPQEPEQEPVQTQPEAPVIEVVVQSEESEDDKNS